MSDVQQSSFLAKTFAMLSDDANSDANGNGWKA
jgi:hypothetical protein